LLIEQRVVWTIDKSDILHQKKIFSECITREKLDKAKEDLLASDKSTSAKAISEVRSD
jgi:hypothetical protein